MRRPLGVSLISFFYIFGAFILLVTTIFYNPNSNVIGIAERFGLSALPEQLVRVIVALFSLGMVYGYFRLKKWGFWLMDLYSVIFGLLSSLLFTNQQQQPYLGNFIWSIIVLAYTVYIRDSFFKTKFQY
ncbi:hypothetical protein A8F94_00905 [Bacillus sp. FJAT-27225]|uniref:hypothetical protein n=1 Tax=Bacillus sp. FJAT-27225 TaxID=1743144 RepID=UPI00080C31C3|nr:hypothetical protein [Bacillus sp. FJAT-27225]OCA90480.1 hypothetical protein A8F94_00905 [Bacillus sp. FJAT-27225]